MLRSVCLAVCIAPAAASSSVAQEAKKDDVLSYECAYEKVRTFNKEQTHYKCRRGAQGEFTNLGRYEPLFEQSEQSWVVTKGGQGLPGKEKKSRAGGFLSKVSKVKEQQGDKKKGGVKQRNADSLAVFFNRLQDCYTSKLVLAGFSNEDLERELINFESYKKFEKEAQVEYMSSMKPREQMEEVAKTAAFAYYLQLFENPPSKSSAAPTETAQATSTPVVVESTSTEETPETREQKRLDASAETDHFFKVGEWAPFWSVEHNRFYYYNTCSEQTTWECPVAEARKNQPPAPVPAPVQPVVQETPEEKEQRRLDTSAETEHFFKVGEYAPFWHAEANKFYYYNKYSEQTTWECPVAEARNKAALLANQQPQQPPAPFVPPPAVQQTLPNIPPAPVQVSSSEPTPVTARPPIFAAPAPAPAGGLFSQIQKIGSDARTIKDPLENKKPAAAAVNPFLDEIQQQGRKPRAIKDPLENKKPAAAAVEPWLALIQKKRNPLSDDGDSSDDCGIDSDDEGW